MDIHHPFLPPKEHIIRFRKDSLKMNEIRFLNRKFYHNPEKYGNKKLHLDKIVDLYDGEINYVDSIIGQIVKELKKKFKKDCLIIVTSDHGEYLYEHGYFGHQGKVYDELLKVPLLITEFGNNQKMQIFNERVELIDLAPTILDYFNIKVPDYFLGKSLLPLIRNKSFDERDFLISECYQKDGKMKRNGTEGYKLLTIRKFPWKYIYNEQKDKDLLFNLERDPKEEKDLSLVKPKKLEEFKRIRKKYLKKVNSLKEKRKINLILKKINDF